MAVHLDITQDESTTPTASGTISLLRARIWAARLIHVLGADLEVLESNDTGVLLIRSSTYLVPQSVMMTQVAGVDTTQAGDTLYRFLGSNEHLDNLLDMISVLIGKRDLARAT